MTEKRRGRPPKPKAPETVEEAVLKTDDTSGIELPATNGEVVSLDTPGDNTLDEDVSKEVIEENTILENPDIKESINNGSLESVPPTEITQSFTNLGETVEKPEKNTPVENWNSLPSLPHSAPLTYIHLIDGEKGGVGKSFFARVLIHYLSQEKISDFVLVDADNTNPDVSQVYGGQCINFSENELKAYAADRIIELALNQSVIVNLPAQVYPIVKDWIINNDLIALGETEEANIKFIKWFVCTGATDSVKLFEESYKDFGDKITHVLVKNHSFTPDWSNVSINVKGKYREVKFPKLSPLERDSIVRSRLTFAAALESNDIKIIGRQRLRNFVAEVNQELNSVKDLLVAGADLYEAGSFDRVKKDLVDSADNPF